MRTKLFTLSAGVRPAVGLALALAATQIYAETQDKIDKAFKVSPGGRLVLDSDIGSVDVRGGESTQVTIEVERSVKARSESKEREILDQHEITFEQNGPEIVVRARRKNGDKRGWNFHNERYQVRFTVKVPQEFNVSLKTSGGGIRVSELRGELKARSSGGGLKFTGIRGSIDGKTSGGGIEIDGCNGPIQIGTSGGGIDLGHVEGNVRGETSGGSIRVTECKGDLKISTSGGGIQVDRLEGRIDGSTSGGSISANLVSAITEDCRLETSGGGITVKLNEKAALDVDAHTSGGRVTTDLPVTIQGQHESGTLRGKMNGGGKVLTLRTSGGGIHIKKF